jgi:excisionase family DNA binding protein
MPGRSNKFPKPVNGGGPARRWASLEDAGEYLGVTSRTIRQMIVDGRITGYRSSARLVRVDLNELDNSLQPFGGQ